MDRGGIDLSIQSNALKITLTKRNGAKASRSLEPMEVQQLLARLAELLPELSFPLRIQGIPSGHQVQALFDEAGADPNTPSGKQASRPEGPGVHAGVLSDHSAAYLSLQFTGQRVTLAMAFEDFYASAARISEAAVALRAIQKARGGEN